MYLCMILPGCVYTTLQIPHICVSYVGKGLHAMEARGFTLLARVIVKEVTLALSYVWTCVEAYLVIVKWNHRRAYTRIHTAHAR